MNCYLTQVTNYDIIVIIVIIIKANIAHNIFIVRILVNSDLLIWIFRVNFTFSFILFCLDIYLIHFINLHSLLLLGNRQCPSNSFQKFNGSQSALISAFSLSRRHLTYWLNWHIILAHHTIDPTFRFLALTANLVIVFDLKRCHPTNQKPIRVGMEHTTAPNFAYRLHSSW